MIRFHTLGAVELRRDGTEVRSVLAQPKRLALLAYLAAAWPQRFHGRDALLGLFWPESDTQRARNSLRQALHQLRRSLGDAALAGRGGWVGVAAAELWCDAPVFDQALADGRLEDALALYRGEFLPGLYVDDAPEVERWLEEERARRQKAAVDAAGRLSERAQAAGDQAGAIDWARRACTLVPADEAVFRRLLRLLHEGGESAAALDAIAEFTRRLDSEYGLAPSGETARLIEQVRSARQPAAGAGAGPGATAQGCAPASSAAGGAPASSAAGGAPASSAAGGAPAGLTPAQAYGDVFSRAVAAAGGAAAGAGEAVHERRRGAGRWRGGRIVAAVLLVAALAAAAWLARPRGESGQAEGTSPAAIAVLPFANLSGDPQKEYFSDGITEELLNVLAQLPGLRVASRTSSFAFKGKDVSVDSIGRALRVSHVLEGSIRTDGGRVRVTAQLIDVATGYHVWSSTYDRELEDIFAMQDEISRAIAERLRLQLTPAQLNEPLARTQTEDPEAHALVLQGSYIFAQNTREAYAKSAEYFRQAIERDPNYARAYTSLAITRMWQANHRYIALDEGYDEAMRLAQKARELDPRIGDPLVVLGWIRMTRERDYAGAEALFAQAEQLTPNDRRIPNYRAILLSRLERVDEAVLAAERVIDVDPTWAGAYSNLGAMYGLAGRYAESVATLHKGLELEPDRPSTHIALCMTFTLAAQYDSALAYGRRAYQAMPGDQYAIATLGFSYGRAGRRAEAAALLRELDTQPHTSHFLRALVYAGTGERVPMFEALERAVTAREDAVPDLPADPAFRPYRQDPRMRALLARIRSGPAS